MGTLAYSEQNKNNGKRRRLPWHVIAAVLAALTAFAGLAEKLLDLYSNYQ